MTSMIATCSVEKKNIEVGTVHHSPTHLTLPLSPSLLQETISTCRFSQRVALVKNEATLNEELDPKLVSFQCTTSSSCYHSLRVPDIGR